MGTSTVVLFNSNFEDFGFSSFSHWLTLLQGCTEANFKEQCMSDWCFVLFLFSVFETYDNKKKTLKIEVGKIFRATRTWVLPVSEIGYEEGAGFI